MKQHKRHSKEVAFADSEFAEVLSENDSGSHSSGRQAQRKAQQFCRQVQRALNLALAENGAIDEVFVEEVSPAPDCGRLLVQIVIPAGRPVAEVIGVLRRETPRLRSEVAKAITRKRAPELAFVPALPEGGADE